MENMSYVDNEAMKRVFEIYPEISSFVRGLPNLGKKYDNSEFSNDVQKILNVFEIYGNHLYELENPRIFGLSSKSLGGGSPMYTEAFPPCKEALINMISSDNLSDYPMAAGSLSDREMILEYLKQEGFKSKDSLNPDNIIFTVSTTEAFNIICKIIARPHDVIIFPGPNYGLFTFVPERASGADVRILPLSEDDNWKVNPEKLDKLIEKINQELKEKYQNKLDYIPRVVAFLNENPHNPLGNQLTEDNLDILNGMGDIALKNNIFIIDDLIYRDLSYENKLAKPLATIEKYFNNVITITGLSKSYGLASIRAGMIIANEAIIRAVRNSIFQRMDSSPALQGRALSAAFNATAERNEAYQKYFKPLIAEYKYRLYLLKALVEGIDSIEDKSLKSQLEKDIRLFSKDEFNLNYILEGIPNVEIRKGTMPDAGFFAILDFSKLYGKVSDMGRTITNEIELLSHLYEQEKIKLILGQSISWPNEDELIGRVTYALEKDVLVNHFGAMNRAIRKLK